MNLKAVFFYILILCLCIRCSNDDESESDPSVFDISFLSGSLDNPKKWKITKRSSDEEDDHPSCKIEHEKNQDNFWFFYLGGDFEFSNGEITEDETCIFGENCCSDLANFRGSWSIETNLADGKFMLGDSLSVTINEVRRSGEDDFTAFTPSEILIRTKIVSLTNENMEWEVAGDNGVDLLELNVEL